MRNEVMFRTFRIIIVIIIFLIMTFLCNNVGKSYEEAYAVQDYILNSLQVKELSNINRSDSVSSSASGSSHDGFKLEVKNSTSKNRDVTFIANDAVKDDDIRIDYEYVSYQVICDGEIVKESVMSDDGILYETTLNSNSKYVYEIKFWINEDATDVDGKKFSINITLI